MVVEITPKLLSQGVKVDTLILTVCGEVSSETSVPSTTSSPMALLTSGTNPSSASD